MQNLLQPQYNLIKGSREVVFTYLELEVRENFFVTLPAFNDKDIRYMLVHIANTYIAWINNFVLKGDRKFFSEDEISTIDQLRAIFDEVDDIMDRFCLQFSENPVQPVKGYKWADKYIETDSYSIFTHVITHEFHHKGQSMTMSRLLGHTPPDTDILRF
jgi:uncharacterized damage-inducible protein DinB